MWPTIWDRRSSQKTGSLTLVLYFFVTKEHNRHPFWWWPLRNNQKQSARWTLWNKCLGQFPKKMLNINWPFRMYALSKATSFENKIWKWVISREADSTWRRCSKNWFNLLVNWSNLRLLMFELTKLRNMFRSKELLPHLRKFIWNKSEGKTIKKGPLGNMGFLSQRAWSLKGAHFTLLLLKFLSYLKSSWEGGAILLFLVDLSSLG